MGPFLWRFLLLVELCITLYGTIAVNAHDIEVSLAADGSVIDKDTKSNTFAAQDTRVHSKAAMPNAADHPDESMSSSKPVKSHAENDVVAIMTTLQQELTMVEQMMKLQQKKLQVLKEMRQVWVQEHQEMEVIEREAGEMTLPRHSQSDIDDVIDKRLETAVAEILETRTRDFDTFFVEKQAIEAEGNVVDVKMMKMSATSAVELVAVAYRDGMIGLFTSGTQTLLRIDTEKRGIKSIVLEAQDEQPCLVVLYDTSSVALYRLEVIEKEKDDVGDGQTAESSQVAASMDSRYALGITDHRDIELSTEASAVAIARSPRQLVVAVAQVDGIVEFFALNGTSLRQVQTNASIYAMETKRNLLACSNKADVLISSMTRAQGSVFYTCPGSSTEVSSIAFDAILPDIMYAGTRQGEILVYAVNTAASIDSQVCRLLSRYSIATNSRSVSPVSLITTTTYVIAAGLRDIAVFNVSRTHQHDVALSRICSKRLNRFVSSTDSHQLDFRALAFSDGIIASHLAIATSDGNGQSKVALFHSLLPNERETFEFRGTMLVSVGLLIIAVVGFQLCFRWQRQTHLNRWDSMDRAHAMPYGKYGKSKKQEPACNFDREDFGQFDSLSDEWRRKIAQVEKADAYRPLDDEADY